MWMIIRERGRGVKTLSSKFKSNDLENYKRLNDQRFLEKNCELPLMCLLISGSPY